MSILTEGFYPRCCMENLELLFRQDGPERQDKCSKSGKYDMESIYCKKKICGTVGRHGKDDKFGKDGKCGKDNKCGKDVKCDKDNGCDKSAGYGNDDECCKDSGEPEEAGGKSGLTDTTGFAIPMVCFCDIPLSQIGEHVRKYGGYAVGLSKEWGIRSGINPVMYELPDSNAINTIKASIQMTLPYLMENGSAMPGSGADMPENESMRKLANQLIFFSCYLKPYRGQIWDGSKFSGDEHTFYDEKEWRYIPDYNKILEKSLKPYIFSHEFLDETKKNAFNELFKKHFRLQFKASDIKYIIVEKECEVPVMAERIGGVAGSAMTDFWSTGREDINLLITKIMSVERLREDF